MNKIMKVLHYLVHDRNKLRLLFLDKTAGWYKSDEKYLKKLFKLRMGKELDLNNPQTFNEKLQWLKLYDRKPEYVQMVDKIEAKKIVASIIGDEYIIPTIGEYDTLEDIDFNKLPNQFVLKTTHGGGNSGVVVCADKKSANTEQIIEKLRRSLSQDIYKYSREWPYKNIVPRILAEQYMIDKEYGELRDYKLFCFDGVVKALFIATGRQTNKEPFFNYYDENGQELDIKQMHPRNYNVPKMPHNFEKMKSLAAKLSRGIPHVRVDFYEINGKLYFGEMTLYHHAGVVPFYPEKWDNIFGSWIKLPKE